MILDDFQFWGLRGVSLGDIPMELVMLYCSNIFDWLFTLWNMSNSIFPAIEITILFSVPMLEQVKQ